MAAAGPNGADLSGSLRPPGREHDTTCARGHGLVDTLNRIAATLGVPALSDLGQGNIGPGFRHPIKKSRGSELDMPGQAFSAANRRARAAAERTDALMKVTFKALRRVSLDPAAINRIVGAALVLLLLEHGRTA